MESFFLRPPTCHIFDCSSSLRSEPFVMGIARCVVFAYLLVNFGWASGVGEEVGTAFGFCSACTLSIFCTSRSLSHFYTRFSLFHTHNPLSSGYFYTINTAAQVHTPSWSQSHQNSSPSIFDLKPVNLSIKISPNHHPLIIPAPKQYLNTDGIPKAGRQRWDRGQKIITDSWIFATLTNPNHHQPELPSFAGSTTFKPTGSMEWSYTGWK